MRYLALLALLLLASSADAQRQRVSINDGWRFWNGDVVSVTEAPTDDWERIDLPHTWNVEDAFDDTEGYRRGTGWYRRQLDVPAGEQRLFLYFEGANQVADVFVNGREAGRHVGGYTAFAVEITELVTPGESAELAVRVNNEHDPNIAPLDADFTFYGGIYRDVWLVATDPVHIDVLDHAGPGVYLDTPELAEGDTRVRARTKLANDSRQPVGVTVRHTLTDPEGTLVHTFATATELAAGAREEVEVFSPEVVRPMLWTPETPHVYHVRTELVVDGAMRDVVTEPLGFRWMSVDADGFVLNGERRQWAGTNRHQDVEGYGNAVPDDLHRRDVQIVKNDGFDFLRLAHYPQDEAVLNETDRVGLAVWEEIPVVNVITMSDAFADNAEQRLVEMIRQHYNHPSIVIWGYMNEILLRIPDPMPDGYIEAVRQLAERLERVVEREDPTRVTAMAISFNEVEYRIADASDIFAFNLYFGWYHDTFEDLGLFLDSLRAEHPDVPMMVSEYGAGSDERIHGDRPVRFDFSIEHAENFHHASFQIMRERPWLVGSAVWNQFDFGSAGRQDTKDGINQKGLYYFDRTSKDVAFLYRAMLNDEPVVEITPQRTVPTGKPFLRIERDHVNRAGPRRQRVRVFTNATQTVGLRMNGLHLDRAPGEGLTPRNGLIEFEVALSQGENQIDALARWIGDLSSWEGDAPPDGFQLFRFDSVTLHYTDTAAFFTSSPDAPPAVALNVGADHSFTGAGGLVYIAEADWPGAMPAEGHTRRTHHRVHGTDEDARFQTYREMPTTWALPELPAGTYDLTFGFSEMDPLDRQFTITVESLPRTRSGGQPATALPVDLSTAGRWQAVEKRLRLELAEPGAPVLRFETSGEPPILSSLVLRRL
ncbi:MAG: glycoside hydrolase family 2 TIM barrel-domain containing protein [Rubricoccaceae bacterium]